MKNIFGKLLDKLAVHDEQPEEDQPQLPPTSQQKPEPEDGIMCEESLLKDVHAKLKQIFSGRQKLLENRDIVLWVSDSALLLHTDNLEFHDRLLCSLADNGFPVRDVVVRSGKAPDGSTPVVDSVAMVISGGEVVQTDAKAEISVFNGLGTLAQDKYLLTAQGAPYAIGRDAVGGNAIAIRGSKDDPNYERNKYVRSHHARIEFMGKYGFRLFVEPDGTYSVGSRTQVRRPGKGSLIELNNPSQPFELLDGDVIILGKNVELIWNTIK